MYYNLTREQLEFFLKNNKFQISEINVFLMQYALSTQYFFEQDLIKRFEEKVGRKIILFEKIQSKEILENKIFFENLEDINVPPLYRFKKEGFSLEGDVLVRKEV